jgi:hypothetical protein
MDLGCGRLVRQDLRRSLRLSRRAVGCQLNGDLRVIAFIEVCQDSRIYEPAQARELGFEVRDHGHEFGSRLLDVKFDKLL